LLPGQLPGQQQPFKIAALLRAVDRVRFWGVG
jgi:hypothetical protein